MTVAECNLANSDLTGCDLRGFIVTKTNFENAVLIGADLRGLQFVQSNCVSAQLCGADLRGASLAYGYFLNVNFRGADLRGANLNESQCNECDFSGADLRGAVFGFGHFNSDFRGADLRGAVIPDEASFEKLNCDIRGALSTPKTAPAQSNKRRSPRIKLPVPLQAYDKQTHNLAGNLIDLSEQGFKLLSRHEVPISKVCCFHILVPGGDAFGARVELEAKSVWSRYDSELKLFNTGFEITGSNERAKKIIQTIIAKCSHKNEPKAISVL